MLKKVSFIATVALLMSGCGYFAVKMAPEKTPSAARTAAAERADRLFWNVFHGGQYERIPEVLTALTGAYTEDPADPVTAAHIGFMHTWRLSERGRLESVPPTITDHAVLARKYFGESYRLHPDPRVLGFLGGITVAEGSIHQDQKLVRQGYYTLLDAIDAWPAFNYFTAGYAASRLPADSERFREALDFQWRNLDACVDEKLDRADPDFGKYMHRATTRGTKRVCWNSWIAPHNFEGFFLNMGDMLVKAGDWRLAQKIYANAKHSPDYDRWQFKSVLETRIEQAQANVGHFNEEERRGARPTNPIMFRSTFACMACHQAPAGAQVSRRP